MSTAASAADASFDAFLDAQAAVANQDASNANDASSAQDAASKPHVVGTKGACALIGVDLETTASCPSSPTAAQTAATRAVIAASKSGACKPP